MKTPLLLALLSIPCLASADLAAQKSLNDKQMAQCLSKATYPADANTCMAVGLTNYQKTLARNNIIPDETYSNLMQACGNIDDKSFNEISSVYACRLGVTKYYLYQGDIMQYMSNGKFSTGQ